MDQSYKNFRKYIKANIPEFYFKPMVTCIIREDHDGDHYLIENKFRKDGHEYTEMVPYTGYFYVRKNNHMQVVKDNLYYFYQTMVTIQNENDYEVVPDVLIYFTYKEFFWGNIKVDHRFDKIVAKIINPATRAMIDAGYGTVHANCRHGFLPYVTACDDIEDSIWKKVPITTNMIKQSIVSYFTSFAEEIKMVCYAEKLKI